MKKFKIALIIWCAVLTVGFGVGLVFFNNFLADYQATYDETRPKVEMDATLPMFTGENVDELLSHLANVDVSTEEFKTQFKVGMSAFLGDKKVAYDFLSGEHTEDRPAYVVTYAGEPVAIVRFKKQAESADYGLPKWEIKSVDWLVASKEGYTVSAPAGVTLKINGVEIAEATAVETGIKHDRARYFEGYAEIPSYNKYSIDHIFGEPIIEATNAYGDKLEVTLDEKTKTYVVDFGASDALRAEVEDYVIQFAIDYAQYITNDTPYNYLDHYFPAGSKLLKGIKDNPRQWYAYHKTPEISNEEIREFTVYDDDTICARVYLEQDMLIYWSGQIKHVVTDVNVFFFKDGDKWKVSGIAFENIEE